MHVYIFECNYSTGQVYSRWLAPWHASQGRFRRVETASMKLCTESLRRSLRATRLVLFTRVAREIRGEIKDNLVGSRLSNPIVVASVLGLVITPRKKTEGG